MAALPRLNPKLDKILEAVLFLLQEAARRGQTLTQYDIVKSVFVADIFHLKKFGRPITFDNYTAMKFGPVPSETYAMLKPDYAGGRYFDEPWPPWERQSAPEFGPTACAYSCPRRPANLRKLSKTDVGELSEALDFVKTLGFGGVRDWTHLNDAYIDAWKPKGSRAAYDMNYTLLLENRDEELVAELVQASKHA
jgi:hypothetical protein